MSAELKQTRRVRTMITDSLASAVEVIDRYASETLTCNPALASPRRPPTLRCLRRLRPSAPRKPRAAISHPGPEAHCARLRAEHERATVGSLPSDPGAIAANAEALRAALVDGAVDI